MKTDERIFSRECLPHNEDYSALQFIGVATTAETNCCCWSTVRPHTTATSIKPQHRSVGYWMLWQQEGVATTALQGEFAKEPFRGCSIVDYSVNYMAAGTDFCLETLSIVSISIASSTLTLSYNNFTLRRSTVITFTSFYDSNVSKL
jgi:hypothetical protein